MTAQLVCERRIDPPAGSEKPGPFVPNAVNVLEGFGSPEVGLMWILRFGGWFVNALSMRATGQR